MSASTGHKSFREGAKLSPLPLFLSRKTTPPNNIFVGEEIAHLRYAEQVLGLRSELRESVTDDDILGHGGLLLQVYSENKLDLSPNVRKLTGIWAADPITKGSAAATAIVRQATRLLGIDSKTLDRQLVQAIADRVAAKSAEDIRGAFWYAAQLLLSPPQDYSAWQAPWQSPSGWLHADTDEDHRLNALYRQMIAWAYVRQMDTVGAKKFGVSPSQQVALQSLNLDSKKVYATICELSRWRNSVIPSYVCALLISTIWMQ